MKIIQKLISICLVAAVLSGSFMITAGATSGAGSDDLNADYSNAIDLLNKLGIIDGIPNPDGTVSLRPEDHVTRAQLAKVFCVAAGNSDVTSLNPSSSSFTDIAGNWASGYISLAESKGLISGRGDSKYHPEDPLTNSELTKTTLAALGYDPKILGLVGTNWQSNVAKYGQQAGLIDSKKFDSSALVTRGEMADMLVAALEAQPVTTSPDGTVSPATGNDSTFLSKGIHLEKITGIMIANGYGSFAAGIYPNKTKNIYIYNQADQPTPPALKVIDTIGMTPEQLGHKYEVWYNEGDGTVYSMKDVTPRVTGSVCRAMTKDDISAFLKAQGFNGLKNGATLVTNYGRETVPLFFGLTNYEGSMLTFIDNDGDGYADLVTKLIKSVGVVTSYNAAGGKLSITDLSSIYGSTSKVDWDSADVTGFDEIYDGCVVLYYVLNGQLFIEPADGAQISVSGTDSGTISGDGHVYTQSGLVADVDSDWRTSGLSSVAKIGDKVVLYLDDNDCIVHIVAQGKDVKDTSNSVMPYVPAAPAAVAAPAFSYSYVSADKVVSITLNCSTPGAVIYYTTLKGAAPAAPTSTSSSVASGATITVTGVLPDETVYISAYATASGMTDSAVVTGTYTAPK